jgi:hypothetical protein
MVHSRRPTARSTSSSAVAKRSKATDRPDQTPGRSGTSTPKTRDLCVGLNFQSLSPGKDHWVHIRDPRTYPLVVNPIVRPSCLIPCETWVPLGPHRLGSRPSPTSGPDLLEDPPTCQWT